MIQWLDEICFGCFISFTEVPQVDQKSQKYILTLKMFVVKRLFVNHRFKVGVSTVYLPAVSQLVITGPSVPKKLTNWCFLLLYPNQPILSRSFHVYMVHPVSLSVLQTRVSALEEELSAKAAAMKLIQNEMAQSKKDIAAKELSVQKGRDELSRAQTRMAQESERVNG